MPSIRARTLASTAEPIETKLLIPFPVTAKAASEMAFLWETKILSVPVDLSVLDIFKNYAH